MGISQYIKEIGRGKEGARSLTREQAADVFGQLLDNEVTDLEVGGFCLAMRIKGETSFEMAGFLDATHARMRRFSTGKGISVVLPSYNGARKLPVLTPLLALLLARQGLAVVLHGTVTENGRVSSQKVLSELGYQEVLDIKNIANGTLAIASTAQLCPGLERLLKVRQVVGLRNSAHSLVKMMNPVNGPVVVVGSYTHPEYAQSMAQTFSLMPYAGFLLRGTEGEPVADPRRMPAMDTIWQGRIERVQDKHQGSLPIQPVDLPDADSASTARWIESVLSGKTPIPLPILQQVAHIVRLVQQIQTEAPSSCP